MSGTALVTGANSGIGLEAAAQLAEAGWTKVILACRSQGKADQARSELVGRVGLNVFETLVIDTAEVASANAASDELVRRGDAIDLLVLNAGASGKDVRRNADGVEITYASTLVGHHVLTMRALEAGLLAPNARIIIAGSEGARNSIPGMKVHDLAAIANADFAGDLAAAIAAVTRLETSAQSTFRNMDEYVTAKLLVAWWAGALARRLPPGMTVNAVSPGAAVGSNFARDAPPAMRWLMMPLFKVIGPLVGMNGSVAQAAARYVEAAGWGADRTGGFWATAHPKKAVGPLGLQTEPAYLTSREGQEATLAAMADLTQVTAPELRIVRAA